MSTRYYVTPYDPVHWKDENSSGVEATLAVDFQDFSKAAQSVWSSYESYPNCSWSVSFDNDEVSGSFSGKDNQILVLERPGYSFNQFVAWYRKYISSDHKLFLFGEGSWSGLELIDGVTDKDISRFTGYE